MEAIRCPGCMRQKTRRPICGHCGFDDRTDNALHQLAIGTVIHGRYELGRVLGQGGFGITYLGWDRKWNMPVAIKEFFLNGAVGRDHRVSPKLILATNEVRALHERHKARFMKEAHTLAQLNHEPATVNIHKLFEDNDTAYMVMEYLDGPDLKDYVRKMGGRLTVEQTFAVIRPIMQALQKVHEWELVHRDISPDNIKLMPGGKIKLIDFGAAREVLYADPDRNLTQSTEAILKRGFAPMEQYQRNGTLGPWTDIYALTATIYYCLTGSVPPEAPDRSMDDAVVEWEKIPGLSEAQIRVLEKGMAVRPRDRYLSLTEMEQDLFGGIAMTQTTGWGITDLGNSTQRFRDPTGFGNSAVSTSKTHPSEVHRQEQIRQEQERREAQRKEQARGEQEARKAKKMRTMILAAVLAAAVGVGAFLIKRAADNGGQESTSAVPEMLGRTLEFEDGSRIEIRENEAGQETERVIRNARDGVIYRFTAEYGGNGEISGQTAYSPDGTRLWSETFTYNESDQLTGRQRVLADGTEAGATAYRYDDEGQLLRITETDGSGTVLSETVWTYSGGLLLSWQEEKNDGSRIVHTCDEEGREATAEHYGPDGQLTKTVSYTRYEGFAADEMAVRAHQEQRGGKAVLNAGSKSALAMATWGGFGGFDGGGAEKEKPASPIAVAITEPEDTEPVQTEPEETLPEGSVWRSTRRQESNRDGYLLCSFETEYGPNGQVIAENCFDWNGDLQYRAEYLYSGDELTGETRREGGKETITRYQRDICGNVVRSFTTSGDAFAYTNYDLTAGITG